MTRLDPVRQKWMRDPATVAVMEALGDARFVGGAVRNALLGEPVSDIDIATPLIPREVIRRLRDVGIKTVPTGLLHGTITAVVGGKSFEITTLRRDVHSDGRHAKVAFGQSWETDALRRDFTINALSATPDGEVFDYVGGLTDLSVRRLRFIGNPAERIAEDVLRVLRLFRFCAWYGSVVDEGALKAAADARKNLHHLSGERIAKEMLKLLSAKTPVSALQTMCDSDILSEISLGGPDMQRLAGLVSIERRNGLMIDPLLRLAAMRPAPGLSTRWKLPTASRSRLENLRGELPLLATTTHREARRLLYQWGQSRFHDRLLLSWAEDGNPARDGLWWALLEIAEFFAPPDFPLSGRDALAAGLTAGPAIGQALREVEDWWIEHDFMPGAKELLDQLDRSAHRVPQPEPRH